MKDFMLLHKTNYLQKQNRQQMLLVLVFESLE